MFGENTEELAQNKLILLYIIDSSTTPFTNDEIIEFILSKNYMNFFLVQQCLVELVEAKLIELESKTSKDNYIITEKGKTTLSYFDDIIPIHLKEDLSKDFTEIEKENKVKSQIIADYFEKENNQFVVSLKLVENEETLFSLYLDAGTKKQASSICNKWKENPEFIYQNIINLLIDDKNIKV